MGVVMSAGLQCFSATGELTVNVTDTLPRLIGSVSTGLNAGSIRVPAFADGRGFAFSMDAGGYYPGEAVNRAQFVVTTAGIDWYFPAGSPRLKSIVIVYGVM